MKRTISFILLTCLLLGTMVSFVSCKMKPEAAADKIEDFLEEISEYNYKKAERLFHSDYKKNLSNEFAAFETNYGVQLNRVLDVDEEALKRANFSENTDSETYTEVYDFRCDVGTHGNRVEVTIVVLNDKQDCGISEFSIRVYKE